MSLTVIADEQNPQLWKVLVAAKYGNVNVATKLGQTGASLTKKTPFGKLPILETAEGTIFEANACTRYIARLAKGELYGKTDFEAAQIEQFLDFANNDIALPGAVWIYPILGHIANNAAATAKATADIKKALDFLHNHLATKTFLVGERITIADIVCALELYYLFQKVLDANLRKSYQNVVRWYTTVMNQPKVKEVVGNVTMAEKAEVAPKDFVPKVAPKEEKKKEEPKKEKKPAAKEAEDDEDETYEDEEPKGANPLDLLPKSSMVLDEWKRQYSNNDTLPVAMPWFWKNLDQQGYSLWKCDFKHNGDYPKVFLACNLVAGWFQRLDKVRKYAFGSVCIFGEEPNLRISGIWLFRGQEVPEEMKVTDDYELYEWKKLDANNESDKQLTNDYFAWEGKFGGEGPFNQGKIFK